MGWWKGRVEGDTTVVGGHSPLERCLMLCRLCQSKEAVKNSHIIPEFVSSWLKETSQLGGLRNVDLPNLRQEDTTKTPLLCSECEEKRLSPKEGLFAEEIFRPFNDEGQLEFTYSDWLLYFVVSLSWRVGQSLLEKLRNQNSDVASHVEIALSDWGNFLLEKPSKSGQYAHHLLFDCMYHCRMHVGPYYDERYALRTIDYAIPYGDERVAVYVKLPGLVFFSGVYPADPTGWKNTRILNSGRMAASGQEVRDPLFWGYMRDSVSNIPQLMNAMSDRQKGKLEERMKTAPPRSKLRRERSKNTGTC